MLLGSPMNFRVPIKLVYNNASGVKHLYYSSNIPKFFQHAPAKGSYNLQGITCSANP